MSRRYEYWQGLANRELPPATVADRSQLRFPDENGQLFQHGWHRRGLRIAAPE
jgi:hypothetical protein